MTVHEWKLREIGALADASAEALMATAKVSNARRVKRIEAKAHT